MFAQTVGYNANLLGNKAKTFKLQKFDLEMKNKDLDDLAEFSSMANVTCQECKLTNANEKANLHRKELQFYILQPFWINSKK